MRVAGELFGVAVERGLSEATQVFAVADGGNGQLTFLLDRPHMKSHIFDASEARGIPPDRRAEWVADALCLIDAGALGQHRVSQLALQVLRANEWWYDFWRQRQPATKAAASVANKFGSHPSLRARLAPWVKTARTSRRTLASDRGSL